MILCNLHYCGDLGSFMPKNRLQKELENRGENVNGEKQNAPGGNRKKLQNELRKTERSS
jgi:hypothetical protein